MEDLIHYTVDMNYSMDNQNCTIIAKVINATKEILYTGTIEIQRRMRLFLAEETKKDVSNSTYLSYLFKVR